MEAAGGKRDTTIDGVNSTTPVVRSPTTTTNAKMVSRNTNGTLVMTSAPSNEAELQLYRVMQRASLLAYYDTLLEMGGDDVQQLCDAGEEEFLEIMALVGMASKPLHVRRLQKALQEWVSNPALFQVPLVSPPPSGTPVAFPPQLGVMRPSLSPQHPPLSRGSPGTVTGVKPNETGVASITRNPVSPGANQVSASDTIITTNNNNLNHHHSSATSSPGNNTNNGPTPSRAGPSTSPGPGSPLQQLQLTPVLLEAQINRLADAADLLVRSLPAQFEPRPHSAKKKVCKELELVMSMVEDDPRRMDEIRKYAAIYGRFDCKRKPEKPLTLHEVSVNEAAAQICRIVPTLLARRDELFPLARQVVRDSGYHYSKPQNNVGYYRSSGARSNGNGGIGGNGADEQPNKRIRLESAASSLSPSSSHGADLDHDSRDHRRRQDRSDQVGDELRALAERGEELALAAQQLRDAHDFAALHSLQQQMEALHSRQAQLLAEQADLQTRHLQPRYCRRGGGGGRDSERPDTDDTDSQFSFSNASSPSQEIGDSRDSSRGDLDVTCDKTNRCKISKQMLQEALVDEGLRVVKEMVANQQLSQTRGTLEAHDGEEPFPEARVQVIASGGGGNIIAVANPALSMSPALQIKTEPNTTLAAESAE